MALRGGGSVWGISSESGAGAGVVAAAFAGRFAGFFFAWCGRRGLSTGNDSARRGLAFRVWLGLLRAAPAAGALVMSVALLRWPLLVTAMTWYAMRDRLGL